jgi:hypothetical protein
MWYVFKSEEKQFPSNGFYDLITGTFVAGPDEMTIHLREELEPESKPAYNYFSGRHFDYEKINYIVEVTSSSQFTRYNFPDVYATSTYGSAQNTIIPVTRVTSDTANHIVGEWYYSCGWWFKTENA